jgi:hypothetical protein
MFLLLLLILLLLLLMLLLLWMLLLLQMTLWVVKVVAWGNSRFRMRTVSADVTPDPIRAMRCHLSRLSLSQKGVLCGPDILKRV